MAEFASDSFTGTGSTELSAYSGVWSKHSSYSGDMRLNSGGTYAEKNGSAGACYIHSATPGSANYTVYLDIWKNAGTLPAQVLGPAGRITSGANTMYFTRYSHTNQRWELYKVVADTFTALSSTYSQTLTDGQRYRCGLVMVGASISVTIDGVERISPATDSAITAAGNAGIREGSTNPVFSAGYYYDDFAAVDDVAAAGQPTRRRLGRTIAGVAGVRIY